MGTLLPNEPIAALLRAEVAKRERGLDELAHEVAASGTMGYRAAERRLRSIITGQYKNVQFDTADRILTAIGLPEAMLELVPIDTGKEKAA